jgi:hypothetical protein
MVLSRWQHYVFHSSPDGDGGEEDIIATHPTPLQAVVVCRRKFWRFIVVGAAAEEECRRKVSMRQQHEQANNSSQKFVHKISLSYIYNSANCMAKTWILCFIIMRNVFVRSRWFGGYEKFGALLIELSRSLEYEVFLGYSKP